MDSTELTVFLPNNAEPNYETESFIKVSTWHDSNVRYYRYKYEEDVDALKELASSYMIKSQNTQIDFSKPFAIIDGHIFKKPQYLQNYLVLSKKIRYVKIKILPILEKSSMSTKQSETWYTRNYDIITKLGGIVINDNPFEFPEINSNFENTYNPSFLVFNLNSKKWETIGYEMIIDLVQKNDSN